MKRVSIIRRERETTIRFSIQYLAVVKTKAKEIKIGYQNLIQALIHNYAICKVQLEV